MQIVSIFYNIHTYLVLSFVITIFLVAKFAWDKIIESLQSKVSSIKKQLADLEKQKKEAENQIEKLKQSLEDYNELMEKSIQNAQEEAKKISEKSSIKMKDLISQKQDEYKETIEKIKHGLSINMQNKIIKLIEDELIKKMKETKNNREIQNININNSIKMIKQLIEKNKN